ncbi:Hypothetical predicted protein [Pelobates cultripes]|uniref:Uncharacterized protein n=1 Tax=Pelobates cultripes TaxID=61616 RepID=A0AAD1VNA5_PELCU|nr:Hypothetical predicted protein [Pelobates cultripes]
MCADGTENTSLLASINSKTAPDVRSRHMGKRKNPWQSSQPLKPPSRDTGGSKRRETAAAPTGQNVKQRLFPPGVTSPSTQRDTFISGSTKCWPTIQPATEQPGKRQIPANNTQPLQHGEQQPVDDRKRQAHHSKAATRRNKRTKHILMLALKDPYSRLHR